RIPQFELIAVLLLLLRIKRRGDGIAIKQNFVPDQIALEHRKLVLDVEQLALVPESRVLQLQLRVLDGVDLARRIRFAGGDLKPQRSVRQDDERLTCLDGRAILGRHFLHRTALLGRQVGGRERRHGGAHGNVVLERTASDRADRQLIGRNTIGADTGAPKQPGGDADDQHRGNPVGSVAPPGRRARDWLVHSRVGRRGNRPWGARPPAQHIDYSALTHGRSRCNTHASKQYAVKSECYVTYRCTPVRIRTAGCPPASVALPALARQGAENKSYLDPAWSLHDSPLHVAAACPLMYKWLYNCSESDALAPTSPHPARILIVDDQEDILLAARLLLKRHFASVKTLRDPATLPELVRRNAFDVLLLDMNFAAGADKGAEGLALLTQVLTLDPQAVVVLITAHGDVSLAVEAMKKGAADFVTKPWEN